MYAIRSYYEKIDHILRSPVELGVPLLATEALYLRHGDPLDADVVQSLLDLIELEGLDNGLDLLHGSPPSPEGKQ